MTKTLREWTAPDGGERVRYNPQLRRFECFRVTYLSWEVWHPNAHYVLDHADALNALRADPYEPEPKGLREEVHERLTRVWDAAVHAPMYTWKGIEGERDALLAIIDRERPALSAVPEDALVAELVRRCGWEDTEHAVVFTSWGPPRMHRALIAPRAAR